MKYTPIDASLFVLNRKRFVKNLKPNSLAIFNSNDIMPSNADGSMGFIQNSDLFYLSGVDQEESILMIFPDAKSNEYKEVLFIKETNEHIAIWEGAKLTKEKATEVSGIKTVYWLSQFNQVFTLLMHECKEVYLNSNEHNRAFIEVETRDARFTKWCRKRYPLHSYHRSAPIMQTLRSIKSKAEVELIREACNITGKGFRRILEFIKPGVMEYEIEAELLHEFIRNRSRGMAYGAIIASGFDACVLHYTDNNKQCKDGDVILIDAAAAYANYASDLTRAIPVNGRFTKRQKNVYNAVHRVFKNSRAMLVPGNTFTEYNKQVGELMQEELVGLKLLKALDIKNQKPGFPAYKKYLPHNISHFLGLDVHDVGDFAEPMKAGMVFTCEPGIYIREENLGIRLENDILVTEKGPVDLMENIPMEADEIEEIMSHSRKK